MHQVFLSYSEADEAIVRRISAFLEYEQISTWYYSRDFIAGRSHLEVTYDAIDKSNVFMIVVSACSLKSDFVFPELLHAIAKGRQILPVLYSITYKTLENEHPRWVQALGMVTAVTWTQENENVALEKIKAGIVPESSTVKASLTTRQFDYHTPFQSLEQFTTPLTPSPKENILHTVESQPHDIESTRPESHSVTPPNWRITTRAEPQVQVPRFSASSVDNQADWTALQGQLLAERFLLQKCIGCGGSGAAFSAHDVRTGRDLCIKLFYSLERNQLDSIRASVERCVRGLASIHHANLPMIYDYGVLDIPGDYSSLYIASEFIHGTSLLEWCLPSTEYGHMPNGGSSVHAETERSNHTISQKASIGMSLASAMQTAHTAVFIGPSGFQEFGVLHGDLTPDNILLRPDKSPVVIDFMIPDLQKLIAAPIWQYRYLDERWREDKGRYIFTPYPTEAYGTPGFMPPEQATKGIVFTSSDIYTLGLTLAHLFFLDLYKQGGIRVPFLVAWHSGWRFGDVLGGAGLEDPALTWVRQIENLIARMTKCQPEDRIQTMKEVEEVFRNIVRDLLPAELDKLGPHINRMAMKPSGVSVETTNPANTPNISDDHISKNKRQSRSTVGTTSSFCADEVRAAPIVPTPVYSDRLPRQSVPGQYEVVSEIGSNGLFELYRVRHGNTGKYLVLMRPIQCSYEILETERCVLNYLVDHQGAIDLYAEVNFEGTRSLLVEDAGPSLADVLDGLPEGFTDENKALRIGIDVADTLSILHHAGVLHRNISPKSVWINMGTFHAKLGNYALAYAVEHPNRIGVKSNYDRGLSYDTLVGTPPYMSPEQAQCKELRPTSDIYSLGAILYKCLSGKAPIEADDIVDVMHRLANGMVVPLHDRAPGLRPKVIDVVSRAMQFEPLSRFQTTDEMADALRDALV